MTGNQLSSYLSWVNRLEAAVAVGGCSFTEGDCYSLLNLIRGMASTAVDNPVVGLTIHASGKADAAQVIPNLCDRETKWTGPSMTPVNCKKCLSLLFSLSHT